jgi:hypothetical protein
MNAEGRDAAQFEIHDRLFRFLRRQPAWAMWEKPGVSGPVCGPAAWQDRPLASEGRTAALREKPRLIASRAWPHKEHARDLTSSEWDRFLTGVFSFLEGPAPLDAVAAITGAVFGAKTSVEPGGEHLSAPQMDAWVEAELDPAARGGVAEHTASCEVCAQRLRAYQAAAPHMSEAIVRRAHRDHPAAPPAGPGQPAEPPSNVAVRQFLRSPQLLLMLAAGLALVIGVPYAAWRMMPGSGRDADRESKAKADTLDVSDLESLPQALAISAREILDAPQPAMPEALVDLAPPIGLSPLYPVSEVIESTRPTLTWDPGDVPPPFTVVLRNAAGEVVVRVPNIANPVLVLPKELERGARYTWELTFSNGATEEASFVVMDDGDLELWQNVRSQYPNSHLVLGLMAQHFGLMSVAENEFQQLAEANPGSQQAARLLENVIALRQ